MPGFNYNFYLVFFIVQAYSCVLHKCVEVTQGCKMGSRKHLWIKQRPLHWHSWAQWMSVLLYLRATSCGQQNRCLVSLGSTGGLRRCDCKVFWWRKQFMRSAGGLRHGRWVPVGQLNIITEGVSTWARLRRWLFHKIDPKMADIY